MSILGMIDSLGTRHKEFLESSYHIRHPRIIEERSRLMDDRAAKTNLMAEPFLEAPPRYGKGKRKFSELDLPDDVSEILTEFADNNLEVFNPPYDHQAEAIEEFLSNNKNVIVTTGTGSGKTEVFLYSILGHIAEEASRGKTISNQSVRALVLYPMNALVSDQLTRMRGMFGLRKNPKGGDPSKFKSPQEILRAKIGGRPFRFAMYTGRSQYHGLYDTGKNNRRLKPVLHYYATLRSKQPELYAELERLGRIPEKNLKAFRGYNRRASQLKTGGVDPKYRTHPDDAEYFARHEMLDVHNRTGGPGGTEYTPNGGSPDLLITNYSMLEYMLLRPIEQPILEDTKQWLKSDPENKLLMVMDEAHLYRGSGGAEVALLLNRLRQRLDIDNNQIRYILTSASFNEGAKSFASQITSTNESDWHIQGATPKSYKQEYCVGSNSQMTALINSPDSPKCPEDLSDLANSFDWDPPPASGSNPIEEAKKYLGSQLDKTPLFRWFADSLKSPTPLEEVSELIFPNEESEEAKEATLCLGNLACFARIKDEDDLSPLLPTRLHLFFRGLTNQYICTNHNCSHVRSDQKGFLGRIYLEPRFSCQCHHRTFLLESCRDCGTAYLHAYTTRSRLEDFLNESTNEDFIQIWTEPAENDNVDLHILPKEEDGPDGQNQTYYLDTIAGVLYRNWTDCSSRPNIIKCEIGDNDKTKPEADWDGFTFTRCSACDSQIVSSSRNLKIQDLETKGSQPISNLSAVLFSHQPEKQYNSPEEARPFPNRGRKILAFSDSRSKASSLSSTIQSDVELDSFRDTIFKVISEQFEWNGGKAKFEDLYYGFAWYAAQRNIRFFRGKDRRTFNKITMDLLNDVIINFGMEGQKLSKEKLEQIKEEINSYRPNSYNSSLLRTIGDDFYSIYKLLIGILEIDNQELEQVIVEKMATHVNDSELVKAVLMNILKQAAGEMAINPIWAKTLRDKARRNPESVSEVQGLDWPSPKRPLFDSGLKEILEQQFGWTDSTFMELRKCVSKTLKLGMGSLMGEIPEGSKGTGPQSGSIDRLCLNTDQIAIRCDTDLPSWHHCNDCLQYSHSRLLLPRSGGSICPSCGSSDLSQINDDNPHVNTRMGFFRNSVLSKMNNPDEHPVSIRAEEHTAQVNNRLDGEPYSKAERYELEFQDVLIDSTDGGESLVSRDQPVDVLSCTTTMEVGIDIGSLTAVVLRTVPPRSDNYQQRAGRAGRRGSSLSTIVSYANNSPHEQHIFNHPGDIISWGEANNPTLQIDNLRIASRHINALFIQKYFTIEAPPDPNDQANVFESIGHTIEFFFKGNTSPHSYEKFREWLDIVSNDDQELDRVGDLLPEPLRKRLDPKQNDQNWARNFVKECIRGEKGFLAKMDIISKDQAIISQQHYDAVAEAIKKNKPPPEVLAEDTLLNFLLSKGFLPTFSFPLDVAHFSILKSEGHTVKERFSPSMGLRQALGTYVPGETLFIDGDKFQSGGLYFPFAPDKENRFNHIIEEELEHVMLCRNCNALKVFENRSAAPKTLQTVCDNCGEPDEQPVLPMLQPSHFSPPVNNSGEVSQPIERMQDYIKHKQSSVLLPVSEEFDEQKLEKLDNSPVANILTEEDRRFYQLNMGPVDEDTGDSNGWNFCGLCGTCRDVQVGNSNDHKRVYPRLWMPPHNFAGNCSSSQTKTMVLGYKFRTDMVLIRVKLESGKIPADEIRAVGPLLDAAQSLIEAIVRAIVDDQDLNIEASELDGHTRILLNQGKNGNDSCLDFYIFDNTPGGSGHAGRVREIITSVLSRSEEVLECSGDCERSCHQCLRTYQNRFHQNSLDRHWANSLLKYITSGEVGELNHRRNRRLVSHMLIPALNAALSASGYAECELSNFDRKTGISTISDIGPNSNEITVHVRSPFSTELSEVDFSLTDHEIMRDIPSVIARIESNL